MERCVQPVSPVQKGALCALPQTAPAVMYVIVLRFFLYHTLST